MKKTILCLALAVVGLLSLAGCGQEEASEPEPTATAVEITKVERSSISSENSVSGQVASGTQESVFVALSVRCTDVYVEVGDTVTAGQTLCTLDMASTWANYETASLSYQTAQKTYREQAAVFDAQIAQAQKNVTDTEALLAAGAASQMELDNARLALQNAQATKTSTLSQLEVSMQNYKASMEQLNSTLAGVDRSGNVSAPISGTILSLTAAKNSYVSSAQPVATIDSTSDMEISVPVSESLVAKLHTGGRAQVTIGAVERTFDGTISTIDTAANQATHLYGVTIKVPPAQANGLLSGMFADVTFYTDTQSNAVVIPTEAIQTGTGGQYVYTLDADNIAHQIPVETGLVGDGVTEITSGLTGGETLVTVGQFYLSDGAQARVVAPATGEVAE